MKNLNQFVKETALFNDSLTEQKIEQDSFVSYSEFIEFSKNCFIDTCDSENLNMISTLVGMQ